MASKRSLTVMPAATAVDPTTEADDRVIIPETVIRPVVPAARPGKAQGKTDKKNEARAHPAHNREAMRPDTANRSRLEFLSLDACHQRTTAKRL